MAYNPATDFFGLWRNNGANVSKLEMPGLDVVIAALARAGLFTLSVSATAPVANQSTTAWLKTAVPSSSAEGQLFLWDKVTTAYLAATAALFLQLLEATAGENGVSWWTSVGGPPLNTVGNNGDFAVRTDAPNGIYGPKSAGAWPATPVPGTADVITSTALDNTFGAVKGDLIYRDTLVWQALAIGSVNQLLVSVGNIPTWESLSALMDTVFGSAQGSVLYRDAAVWNDLGPGVASQVLQTNGPAANPSWANRSTEFDSGTVMVFQQSAAPTNWTKLTALNDYGLRVVSGAAGTTPGTPFSTVFAQTSVGNHTLTLSELASHSHTSPSTPLFGNGGFNIASGGATNANSGGISIASAGGDGPHSHSVQLALSYVDVILASKN